MWNTVIRTRKLEGIGTEWTWQFVVYHGVMGIQKCRKEKKHRALLGTGKVLIL